MRAGRAFAAGGTGLVLILLIGLVGGSGSAGTPGDGTRRGPGGGAPGGPGEAGGPAGELASAVGRMTTTYRFTSKVTTGADSGTIAGSVDPSGKRCATTFGYTHAGGTVRVESRAVGKDLYVNLGELAGLPLGAGTARWLRLDRAKITSVSSLGIGDLTDPSAAGRLVTALVTAERTGTGGYRGALDLTRLRPGNGITAQVITEFGGRARNVPFEVRLDGRGRLKTLRVTVPGYRTTPATTVLTRYSGWGDRVQVTRPRANQVAEASEAVYGYFNAAA